MDGLLLDSERIVKRSWEEAGNEMGIPGMGEHIFHTLGLNRAGTDSFTESWMKKVCLLRLV